MTPISALSFLPIPGPPPSGQAGVIATSPALAIETVPGVMPLVSGEAAAVNWLVAWLGDQRIETDAPEAMPEATAPPASVPSKVHWMSLLPAVAAFVAPVSAQETRSGEEPASPEMPVQLAEPEMPVVPVVVGGTEEKDVKEEQEEPAAAIIAEPLPIAPAPPVPIVPAPPLPVATVATVATSIVVPVPIPVDIDLPTLPSADALTPKAARSEPPIGEAAPNRSAPMSLPAVNGTTQRPAARREDKGEVIWSAKFAVKEEQVVDAGIDDSVPEIRPQPKTIARLIDSAEAVAPAKPAVAGVRASQPEEPPRQQLDPEHLEAEIEKTERKQAVDFPRERPSGKNTQDSKQESNSSGSEHPEPKQAETGARTSTFAAEFVHRAAAPSRVSETAPVEGVVLEPAAPLKPAQIATLQVDVPAPVGSDDMTPMRLVVSQRGDQVNVRLRSFPSVPT